MSILLGLIGIAGVGYLAGKSNKKNIKIKAKKDYAVSKRKKRVNRRNDNISTIRERMRKDARDNSNN